MKQWIVMRAPCLQEDEGRHSVARIFPTKEEARAWVAAQKGEYFTSGDYYVVEVEE